MIAAGARWSALQDDSGHLWIAYYAPDGELVLRTPEGKAQVLAHPRDGRRPAGLELFRNADRAGVLWRDTTEPPGLYVLDRDFETDAAMRYLESPVPALTRMAAARVEDDLLVLWYGDATGVPDPERYRVFLHRQRADAAEGTTHSVLPGFFPRWIVADDGSVGVFSWARVDDAIQVLMRRLRPDAVEFEPVQVVAETPRVTPIFQTFRSDDRWFVLWVGQYGSGGQDLLLQGAWSDDEGDSWQAFAFDTLLGLDISHVAVASDGSGHLLLAVSGNYRFRDPHAREDIFVLRSSDNGTSWEPPRRLRDETAAGFHARHPVIAFGRDPGQLLVAWEDWETIRPSIQAAYSRDAGATWQLLPLTAQWPRENHRLAAHNDALFATETGFAMISERFDDTLTGKELVLHRLDREPIAAHATDPAAMGTDEQLRERVDTYWQAMQAHDFSTTYRFLDPFFRARWPEASYRQRMGLIHYHGFEIHSISRSGRVADVATVVQASVPEFVTQGRRLSQPLREIPLLERWIWVDGDWHREMVEEATETRYTRY